MFLLRLLLCQCLMLFASQAAPSSIADFAAKAEKRQPLSVVFFGGSLTFGANASDPNTTSYRGLMTRWLREEYPNTPITFHDASIGGTGSQLGMFRLERDVLSHRPDLVFLDFTVNDGAEETDIESLASYERIVRELMATDAAVMPVLMLFKWHAQKPDDPLPPRHTQHLKLAQCYRLPAADVLSSVRTQMKTGVNPDELWNLGDGAHPGDEGYELFFQAVRDRFAKATTETTRPVIPSETVFENLYPSRKRALLTDTPPTGWSQEKTRRTSLWFDGLASRWMGDVAAADKDSPMLRTTFRGSMVGIFGERDGFTPPIRVWIDGQPVLPPKGMKGSAEDLWKLDTTRFAPPKKGSGNLFLWQALAKGLPDGEHTLWIEPVFDGESKDAQLRIESVCSAGR